MSSEKMIGTISKPWVSIVLGVGTVAMVLYSVLVGTILNQSVTAALLAAASLSLAVWAYNAARAVVLVHSPEGIMIRSRGLVTGPITKIVLIEKFHVSPWHYDVLATCADGSTVGGVLFPPPSMMYSREEFTRQLKAFVHPLVGVVHYDSGNGPTEIS